MIVLDTNVVSELMRPAPSPDVVAWLRRQPPGSLATTAITVAEIRFGLALLPRGRRSGELVRIAGDVLSAFPGQVLPFDVDAADHHAAVAAGRQRAGQPMSGLDAEIAAICRAHDASLATRNTRDFLGSGIELIDPWVG